MANEGRDDRKKGLGRREVLECMVWAGTGVLWTISGGVPHSVGLIGEAAAAAPAGFTFMQMSDSHIGFDKKANPDALGTLREAIAKVKAMPMKPSFIIHTGDITHLSKPEEFDNADKVYNGICALIDDHIARNGIDAPAQPHYAPVWQPTDPVATLDPVEAGISTIIWTTGFRADWSWVELPIFDGAGYPTHRRGVTSMDGVYVLGLPWLYTWGSGRFVGVARDSDFIAKEIVAASSDQSVAA